jgi:hypothetical protein
MREGRKKELIDGSDGDGWDGGQKLSPSKEEGTTMCKVRKAEDK